MFLAGTARATLLWDGNATNGTGVFKILDLEDENGNSQNNPSPNGSSITAVSDPIYGTVWQFYKALNDLRCEAHGANGINPAIGSAYYIGWRFEIVDATKRNLECGISVEGLRKSAVARLSDYDQPGGWGRDID